MTKKLFGITGWKNSGKTTLTEQLVTCLTKRGYKIATIKHAHHDADVDHVGTDSWRHRKAGASEVALVSSKRYAIMHENAADIEPNLDEIAARLSPCDLVLVEGFKNEPHRKIELRRKDGKTGPRLSEKDPNIIAVASDHPQISEHLPVFDINDIAAIADFIEQQMAICKNS